MSNVVEIAQKYHQKLRGELAKVDEFLAYAERLSNDDVPEITPTARDEATRSPSSESPATQTPPPPAGPSARASEQPGSDAPSNGRSSLFREPSREGGQDREKASG